MTNLSQGTFFITLLSGKIQIRNSNVAGKQGEVNDVIKQRFSGAAPVTSNARPTLWQ